MSRVVHFEIMAREPQKAIDFYSKVLDWKFQRWVNPGPDYWLVGTGDEDTPGIDGGLATGDPVSATVNTIGTVDIDATIEKIEENGGKVIQPCVARPGMGWFATFEDPVGNRFGLLQADTPERELPETVQGRQQSLTGFPVERIRLQTGHTAGKKTARRAQRAVRRSPASTSRTRNGSSRPRNRASR